MKDILDLAVSQIRIFAVDVIPLRALRTHLALTKIKDAFGFAQVATDAMSGTLIFQGGNQKIKGEQYVFENLGIESRRIQVQILGSSEVADACYTAVCEVIAEFNRQKAFNPQPLMKSEETTCTVTLDFQMDKLFAREVLSFAKEDLLPKTPLPGSKALVRSLKLAVEVGYAVQDQRLNEQGITLSPKLFTIEPRAGTTLEDRRYLTSSPLDSKSHLQVLEQLEGRLKRN